MASDTFLDRCVQAYRARLQRDRAAQHARQQLLRSQADEAAQALVDEYGARAVWLFGSLAWGKPHERSDVDLLVEGLPVEHWSRAHARAEAIINAPVDLVARETAAVPLQERVLREGVLLHAQR